MIGDRTVPFVWMVTKKVVFKWNSGANHGKISSRLRQQLAWRPWGGESLACLST